MSVADVVGIWIGALPLIIVFFLAYGFVEEAFRSRRQQQHIPQIKPSAPPEIEPPAREPDFSPCLHAYDSPELFRSDALLHMHELQKEVTEHEQNIQAILEEMRSRERGE